MKIPFRSRLARAAIFVFLAAGSALAQTAIARVTQMTGVVTRRHDEKWSVVSKAPADLYDGDKIVTDRGRATVQFLGDGSTVVLDVGTNVTIRQSDHPMPGGFLRRVEVFAGDLWFRITKSPQQSTAFVTPTAVGGVRGTEGAIHVETAEDSKFTLNEGALAIKEADEEGNPKEDAEETEIKGGETCAAKKGVSLERLHSVASVLP